MFSGKGRNQPVPVTPLRPDAPPHRQAEPAGASPGPKRLTVGPGISLAGEVTACDLLVVQGSARVALNDTRAIEVAEGGRFTEGRAEVEEAEVAGLYEGELTVRGRLTIHATGRVRGAVRYGELEIEPGGELSGSVEVLERTVVQLAPPQPEGPEAASAADRPEVAGAVQAPTIL